MKSVHSRYLPCRHWGVLLLSLLMCVCCSSSEAQVSNSSSTHITPTSTLATTTTTSTPPSISPSSVTTTTTTSSTSGNPSPTPHPVPDDSPLVNFTNTCVYVYIGKIKITFSPSSDHPKVNNTDLQKLGVLNNTLSCTSKSISYQRYYGTNAEKPQFVITFMFEADSSAGLSQWVVKTFQHRNLSTSDNDTKEAVIYMYGGFEDSVWAPMDLSYRCGDLEFHGDGGTGTEVTTQLTITDLRLQAFVQGKPSTQYVVCGEDSKNNNTIDLVVGLSVGISVVVAAIVIVLSVFAYFKFRRRDYNLLE